MTKRPQTQDVHDDAPAGKYFTQILNMADDDLDPYEYRLLGHYKRVIGELNAPCTQGTRLIAEICRMSLGKVTAVRKQLEEKGWIRCERRPNNTIRVTLIDRMAENVARYSKRSQDEQARSPHEHGVRHMNTTVHDVNEEITRTPTKEQSIPIGIEPAAKAAAKRKKSKANPRSAELEPDIIYETVETHIFGIEGTPDMPYQWSGRCGQITSWLKGAVASVDGQEVGKISRPAAPEHIKAFARAWVKEHTGAPLPRKPDRFVEHWRAWASKQAAARPRTDLQEATPEDKAALVREYVA